MTELEKAVYKWGHLGLKAAFHKLGAEEFIRLAAELVDLCWQLKQDIAERDAHWRAMIDSKNELIEVLRGVIGVKDQQIEELKQDIF